MEPHSILLISLLGLLLLGSAFFSACEMAFASLNRLKIKNLAAKGHKRALTVLELLDTYDRILSTVLIGNTIVNIGASAIAAALFVGFLGNAGVSAATAVMTILVLLFGEISPKTLAKESPEQFALFAVPFMRFFIFLFSPLNSFFSLWKRFILRLFKIKKNRTFTEEELLTFVTEMREEGGINEREEDMIHQAIAFDDLSAGDIITPRVDVKAVSLDDSLDEIENIFYSTGLSRLPVYRDSIDNITGVILQKDFYFRVIKKKESLAGIVMPMVFVPPTMRAPKLLAALNEKKSHMAAVIDEYGGLKGIVTVEDIVEELVGEIWDEHDHVVEPILRRDDGSYVVQGNANLKDMFEALDMAAGDEKDTTVGNWVMEKIEGRPKEGEGFHYKTISVKITKALGHWVKEITVDIKTES